jgi:hypothetical protein
MEFIFKSLMCFMDNNEHHKPSMIKMFVCLFDGV